MRKGVFRIFSCLISKKMFVTISAFVNIMDGGAVVTSFVSGGFVALFYISTQDLFGCMVAHAVMDGVDFLTADSGAWAS
jgi:hypothetical protein